MIPHEPRQSDVSAAWALLAKLEAAPEMTSNERAQEIARAFAKFRVENLPPVPDAVTPRILSSFVQLDLLFARGQSACALLAKTAPGRELRDSSGRCIGRIITAWVTHDQIHGTVQLSNGSVQPLRIA